MAEKTELKSLRSAKTGDDLIKLVQLLRKKRREKNIKDAKRRSLTPNQRKEILAKTNARCHVCGVDLQSGKFHADHVQTHISGGPHEENNYLPSCQTCNNYRWHFAPEELQIILKLGVWAKGQLLRETEVGQEIAGAFMKHEMNNRKRKASKHFKE